VAQHRPRVRPRHVRQLVGQRIAGPGRGAAPVQSRVDRGRVDRGRVAGEAGHADLHRVDDGQQPAGIVLLELPLGLGQPPAGLAEPPL